MTFKTNYKLIYEYIYQLIPRNFFSLNLPTGICNLSIDGRYFVITASS
jgi:hypothetical protein